MRRFDFFPKDPSYGRRRKKKRWKRYFVDDLFDLVRTVFLVWVSIPHYFWELFRSIFLNISYIFLFCFKAYLFIINLNVKLKNNIVWFLIFIYENFSKQISLVLNLWLFYYKFSIFHFFFFWVDIFKSGLFFWKFASSISYLHVFIFVYDLFLFMIFLYLIFLIIFLIISVIAEIGITFRFCKFFIFGEDHKKYFHKLSTNHLNVILKYLKRIAKRELSLLSSFFIIFRWIFLITPIYWTFMLSLLWFRFQLLHTIYLLEKLFAIKVVFLLKLVAFLNFLGKWHNTVIRFINKFSFINFFLARVKKIKILWRKLYIFFWWQRVYWRKFLNVIYRKIWKFVRFFYVERNLIFSLLWWLRFFFLYFLFFVLISLDFLSYGYYWFKIRLKCFRFFYLNFYLYPKFFKKRLISHLNVWRISFLVVWFRFFFFLKNFFYFFFFRLSFLKILFDISLFINKLIYIKFGFYRFDQLKVFCRLKINCFSFIQKLKQLIF